VFASAKSRTYKASGFSEIMSVQESHLSVPWETNRTASDLLEKANVSLFSSDQKEEFSEAGSLRKELRDEHFHQTMFRDGLKEGLEEACH